MLSFSVAIFIGVLFDAARKEVFYLCGNFKEGVAYSDVIRQLDTANLSTYSVERTQDSTQIKFSSAVNLHYFTCTINFNANELVVYSKYD